MLTKLSVRHFLTKILVSKIKNLQKYKREFIYESWTFWNSYFQQISGVATSIRTLALELEKLGHEVSFLQQQIQMLMWTTNNIIRLQSIPFVSLAERKIVLKGVFAAYLIAKEYDLDIIHTQTEFGMGILGKMVAAQLRILSFIPYILSMKIMFTTSPKDA